MQYRIGAKVVLTVTDNAAYFVKAADNSESSASADSSSENIVDDDNDELTFADVTDLYSPMEMTTAKSACLSISAVQLIR